MTLEELRASLGKSTPPPGLSALVRALWLAARGDWEGAHAIAQEDGSAEGAWVHAHLHRAEGDAGNAAYWYARAGKPVCADALEAEWAALARSLLAG